MSPSLMDNSLGVLFNATVISSALYGAGCLQAWIYFRKYKNSDGWKLQSLVTAVIVFDTAQQATISGGYKCTVSTETPLMLSVCFLACVYNYLVTNHDDPLVVGKLFNTLIIECIFSDCIAILVQQFYCYRIYQLSKNWALFALTSFVSLASFVILLVFIALGLQCSTFEELAKIEHLSMSCNILAAVADVLISAVLIFILRGVRTEFKASSEMIDRLVLFVFNTGLPTSVCSILACVFISALPQTFWYILFFLLMGRLYTNSFLVTLNSRDYIAGKHTINGMETNPMWARETVSSGRGPRYPVANNTKESQIVIRMDTVMDQTFADEGYGQDPKVSRSGSRSKADQGSSSV